MDLEPIWENIRSIRNEIDYKQKSVLDIASFDGLFAFEAEDLGASTVIATDCLYKSFRNFLFCRDVLGSNVIPYYNVSPYNLVDRLDVYFDENYDNEQPNSRLFDIVQHLGLLYHLQNPLLSLMQARSVLKTGGTFLIETDIILGDNESKLVFNGLPNHGRVRDNSSVWWAPTKLNLLEMLRVCFFDVADINYSEIDFSVPVSKGGKVSQTSKNEDSPYRVGRAALSCKAVAGYEQDHEGKVSREVFRTYRNPGFDRFRLWGNKGAL